MEKNNKLEINFSALGTDIFIKVVNFQGEKEELEKEIENFYSAKEKIFSRFDENSELNYLNNNLGRFQNASCDIIILARRALSYYKKSRGLFDPRIIENLENIGYKKDFRTIDFSFLKTVGDPKAIKTDLAEDLKIEKRKICFSRRMDFSGLAKGYITDQVAVFLEEKGYQNFLVDSGGDMRVFGKDSQGDNWSVSLEGVPENKMSIELTDDFPAVATSGISRKKWIIGEKNFHHLINPKEPSRFYFDTRSVTVLAGSAQEADALAKIVFLMGKDGGKIHSEKNNIKSLFLNYQGDVWASPGIKNNLIISG